MKASEARILSQEADADMPEIYGIIKRATSSGHRDVIAFDLTELQMVLLRELGYAVAGDPFTDGYSISW